MQPSANFEKVTEYSSESRLRKPRIFFAEMRRDFFASRELAWRLLVRDISARYRQSFLGIFWAFIPPIIAAVGLTMAKNANVININTENIGIPYPAYVMFSMTLWQIFIEAVNVPFAAATTGRALLSKINFPREALILTKVGHLLFNFSIRLILIIVLFVWFRLPLSWTLLLAPLALMNLIVFGMFIGFMLMPLSMLFQDIARMRKMLFSIWFFITPVLYAAPTEGLAAKLMLFNPVTPLIVTTRNLAIGSPVGELMIYGLITGMSFIGLFLGFVVFRLAIPFIVERTA